MNITEPCAVQDLDDVVYHGDPCPEPSLSYTMAKEILKPGGPARVQYQRHHPRPPRRVFDIGSAAHTKILGRGAEIAIYPAEVLGKDGAASTKLAKDWEAAARADGLIPLKADEAAQVDAMAEVLLAHPVAAELLTQGAGEPELSLFAIDPETSRWLRGRIDFVSSPEVLVDLKTSGRSVDPATWTKTAWDYGYFQQAAHYLSLAVALGVASPDARFLTIAQEKTPPYLVAVHEYDDELLAHGVMRMRHAIDLWDQCLTTQQWPGLPTDITAVRAPRWADISDSIPGVDPDLEAALTGLLKEAS